MRLVKRVSRFLKGQTGISFVEVVVAVAILAFIGVSLLRAFNTNVSAAGGLDEKVVATNLATAYIEAIKASPYDITEPYYDDAVAGITVPPQYYVNIDIDFTDDGDTTDGITWIDEEYYTDETIQKITITISREGGKHILTICAFKTKRVVPES